MILKNGYLENNLLELDETQLRDFNTFLNKLLSSSIFGSLYNDFYDLEVLQFPHSTYSFAFETDLNTIVSGYITGEKRCKNLWCSKGTPIIVRKLHTIMNTASQIMINFEIVESVHYDSGEQPQRDTLEHRYYICAPDKNAYENWFEGESNASVKAEHDTAPLSLLRSSLKNINSANDDEISAQGAA